MVKAVPAERPTIVLLYPVVKASKAWYPTATLFVPELYGADVVPPLPASAPTKVL